MSEYRIMVARITLFPQLGSEGRNAAEIYQRLWGKMPDSFNSLQQGPFPTSVAQGRLPDFQLLIQQQPTRLDLTFQPLPIPKADGTLIAFGADANLSQAFSELAQRLPNALTGTALNRVASYLQVSSTANDTVEANRFLLSTMPDAYKVKLEAEEDFILQVNLPQSSERSSIFRMNYITRWSVERVTVMTLVSPGPGGQASSPTVKNYLTPSIALDNSTAPTQEALGGELAYELLRETFEQFGKQLSTLKMRVGGFENAI